MATPSVKLNKDLDGLRAYIDSMQIGDITIRNIIAYVGTEGNNKGLGLIGMDALLGQDVMQALGEIQISVLDSTLIFPAIATPIPANGCNMLAKSIVKAQAGNETFAMSFDTGNGNINACYLYAPYYKAHAAQIDATAKTDTISAVAYGVAGTKQVKMLTDFSISIGNHPIKVDEAIVENEDSMLGNQVFGNIGMTAVMQSRKITLNFKDMFIKLE